jgi:hypothetical protein
LAEKTIALDSKYFDYLSQELFVANACAAIAIVLESNGTICELGAFTSFRSFVRKIYVLEDKKLRRKKSFLNRGPISKLKRSSSRNQKNQVLFCPLSKPGPNGTLIPISASSIAANRLLKTIDYHRSFPKQAFEKTATTFIVRDLYWFFLTILELALTEAVIREEDIIPLLLDLFSVNQIGFQLSDELKPDFSYDCVSNVVRHILAFSVRLGFLRKDRDNYFPCRSKLKNFTTILFTDKYYLSSNLCVFKAKNLNTARRLGLYV